MMIAFVPLFSQRVWPHVLTLEIGARLALGKRAVQILRVIGLAEKPQVQPFLCCRVSPRLHPASSV